MKLEDLHIQLYSDSGHPIEPQEPVPEPQISKYSLFLYTQTETDDLHLFAILVPSSSNSRPLTGHLAAYPAVFDSLAFRLTNHHDEQSENWGRVCVGVIHVLSGFQCLTPSRLKLQS